MAQPITFDHAQARQELRQAYIDSLDLGPMRMNIASVVYFPYCDEDFLFDSKTAMEVLFHDAELPRLNIYGNAFEDWKEADFLSSLIDHELTHVQQWISPETRNAVLLPTRLIKRINDCRESRNWTRRRLDGTVRSYQLAISLLEAAMEIPAYTHQITDGVYAKKVSNYRVEEIRYILSKYSALTEAVRSTTGLTPESIVDDTDSACRILKLNVKTIDHAIRGEY
ncbi:TPA: hypothetical protein HA251_04590 [Candidatus Woesearchaeota archaeon]|nr:hypothetical protein [Candidatus Woesearchaeota archaeon]